MSVNQIWNYFKLFCAGACTTVVGLLGGCDIALKVLVSMTVIDIITGVLKGIYQKRLSSNIGYKGFIKKIGIYIMVATAYLLDQVFNTGIIMRTMAIGFYIGVEGISIVENWGEMDLPLPEFIKKALLQLKERSNKGETNENIS